MEEVNCSLLLRHCALCSPEFFEGHLMALITHHQEEPALQAGAQFVCDSSSLQGSFSDSLIEASL